MNNLNRRLPQVDPSHFAMVPRSDVPRSAFKSQHTIKDTFNVDQLVPIHIDEVLPGDIHDGHLTVFARVSNLLFPLMDNLTVETFFFFVPARLVWSNWQKFMGEQNNPTDSIDYTIPTVPMPSAGFAVGSLYDHFGLPTAGQITGSATLNVNALPLRAYNLIYNEWFRDQNLENSIPANTGDGPDAAADYIVRTRCKKHDYFTSALPWPLKGGVNIILPIGGTANVKTALANTVTGAQNPLKFLQTDGGAPVAAQLLGNQNNNNGILTAVTTTPAGYGESLYPSNLYADLSTATGATVNSMRLAAATQQFLEKDARGGTRYTELLRNHFGVHPEDSRLQRPEYIGGGRSQIHTNAIPQTSATGLTGGTTPIGALTGQALVADSHRFKYHATEHGYIIGLVNITGDVTYQQGLNRLWSRETRFDFYWPTFAHLGEQTVLNKEIYCKGDANDDLVFGYQERWAEYRYRPSRINGLFRSTSLGNIDEWHLAQEFGALPTLNTTFIKQATPASRVLAAGANANEMQILWDSVFQITSTRPIPTYSVPGLTRF